MLGGIFVLLVGSFPRNLLFAANLRFASAAPWSVPVTAGLLWLFCRYVRNRGPPVSTSEERRTNCRATPLPARVWAWALLAGGLGLVALVLALRVANRLVELPPQAVPDLEAVPRITIVALILMGGVIAGVDWQTSADPVELVWSTGPDASFWAVLVALLLVSAAMALAFRRLRSISTIPSRRDTLPARSNQDAAGSTSVPAFTPRR